LRQEFEMNRMFVIALSTAVGVVGMTEGMSPASAAEAASKPSSLDQVRDGAMAALASGDVEQVGKRGRRGYRGRGSYGGGRHYGRRGWGGGRRYGNRRYYGRRYYGGRRYRHGRNYGGAVAAGVAGLVIGSAIAGSARPGYRTREWCAQRYRSYNPRTGTYVPSRGRIAYCP
jgi:hypothetical protein